MNGAGCTRLPAVQQRPRRLSAVALLALATTQLATASAADLANDPVALLTAVLGVAGLLTAIRLGTAGCVESRIATGLLAGAALIGVVLSNTLGAPGSPASSWTLRDILLGTLALGLAAATIRAGRRPAGGLWRR
ncbi:hypothetical protein [Microbacterium hydrocarbonoxydans]|uniref:hypothetical protein n=1 Tax=Microbacterium hydrocarbonoxydans TaxID=273678 RepID=UPI0013DB5968|nr:hypothetical protein [Microbacterium hydrocarbonoxydans]